MATLIVDISFSGANTGTTLILGDTTRGKIGTGTLGSGVEADVVFNDVTSYVRSGSVERGRNRVDEPIIQYETGTASVTLDNRDRRFDPTNLDGPYVSGGLTLVKPRRAIRFRATWNSVTYDLLRGFTSNFDVQWPDQSNQESVTEVPCSDAFKILSGINRIAVSAVGAGEDTGARINRILDSAGWTSVDRLVSTGNSTVQSTTLGGNVLEELQLVADTEIGELYIDGSGRVVFRNRTGILTDDRSLTSQAIFDDDAGSGNLMYHGLGLSTDDSTLANQVKITRVGGATQIAEDTASQVEYYIKTYERDDILLQTDATANDMADWLLYQSKDTELRFTEITILPQSDPDDLWPQVLGREIGDKITIIHRPPGGGDPIERECFIRGIKHDFTPDTWSTTWALQSAFKASFLVLDDPVLSIIGANALGY